MTVSAFSDPNGIIYTYVRPLGQGAFGKTYLYRRYDNGLLYTVKVFWSLPDSHLSARAEARKAQAIIDRIGNCTDPHIVCYENYLTLPPFNAIPADPISISFYQDMELASPLPLDPNEPIDMIITRYVEGMTLAEIVQMDPTAILPRDIIIAYLEQIPRTLAYLHSKYIAHGDVSITNIIYDSATQNFTLIDFGNACVDECEFNIPDTPEAMTGITTSISVAKNRDVYGMLDALYNFADARREYTTDYRPQTGYSDVDTYLGIGLANRRRGLTYLNELWVSLERLVGPGLASDAPVLDLGYRQGSPQRGSPPRE